MQGYDCKAAFLSKEKSVTASVPRRASPPGLPPACVSHIGGKMEKCSCQGMASPTGLTFSLSLQREPRLQPQGWGTREKVSADPPALRAPCRGDNEGAWGAGGEPGTEGGPGHSPGLSLGQAPRSFPGEPRSAEGTALFRGAAGRRRWGPGCPAAYPAWAAFYRQEEKLRKLIAMTYKGKLFRGSPPPSPFPRASTKRRQVR